MTRRSSAALPHRGARPSQQALSPVPARVSCRGMATLGTYNVLPIIRESTPGLYLDGGELGEILLPKRYIPRDIQPKDKLEVFIYRDSEDRLVATTEQPIATVGEFACLRVIGINDRTGAFLDWGLSKDLLLPFREHVRPVKVGDRVVVYILVDPKTERIIASMRLNRHFSRERPLYRPNAKVDLLISGSTPLGYEAVVDGRHRGLLFRDNIVTRVQIGQQLKGFVRAVRPNGQIDLSLDAAGYSRVGKLTDLILEALRSNGGKLDFDDDSSPELIRQRFGVSKKAFKQALGSLYKERQIEFRRPGIELVAQQEWSPGR
jgi:uncharacterized protein